MPRFLVVMLPPLLQLFVSEQLAESFVFGCFAMPFSYNTNVEVIAVDVRGDSSLARMLMSELPMEVQHAIKMSLADHARFEEQRYAVVSFLRVQVHAECQGWTWMVPMPTEDDESFEIFSTASTRTPDTLRSRSSNDTEVTIALGHLSDGTSDENTPMPERSPPFLLQPREPNHSYLIRQPQTVRQQRNSAALDQEVHGTTNNIPPMPTRPPPTSRPETNPNMIREQHQQTMLQQQRKSQCCFWMISQQIIGNMVWRACIPQLC